MKSRGNTGYEKIITDPAPQIELGISDLDLLRMLEVGSWMLAVGSSEGWHCSCSLPVMLDVTISILALIAGGVTMELFTIMQAPLHGGNEAGLPWRAESAAIAEDSQIGNPS